MSECLVCVVCVVNDVFPKENDDFPKESGLDELYRATVCVCRVFEGLRVFPKEFEGSRGQNVLFPKEFEGSRGPLLRFWLF